MRIAHFSVDFRLGNQRCDRVNDNEIDATGANQLVGNLQALFSAVGLRNQKLVEFDT